MFPITGRCPKSVDMFLTNRQIVDMFLDAFLRTGTKNDYLFHFLVPCGDRIFDDKKHIR